MDRKQVRDALAISAAVAAGIITVSEYERHSLTTVTYRIKSRKRINADRTLVFLTDLHDKQFGDDNKTLLNVIDKCSPDAVLIGGDMMICKSHVNTLPTLDLCERLSDRYPVYYGDGNHETRMHENPEKYGHAYGDFVSALRDMGVYHLEDESAMLDDDIVISGLDITKPYYTNVVCKQMNKAYITDRLGEASDDMFQILLSHSPLFLPAYAAWGADLTLAGHFHGGTIRLGTDIGLMTPQFQFFSRNVVGLKEQNGSSLIISSGLGTHSVNIRLNNKPQVVVVMLEK